MGATGVFWAAFTMFAATTASIYSRAVIERIRMGSFIFLAILLGSVAWIVSAAWGWHPDGWLVTEFGYHSFGAAGVVHMVSGCFALGVLINLGPRIGKFNADGSANAIPPHNLPLTLVGLMAIIVGFFGFLGGCIIYNTDGALEVSQWVTIYGTPATLSAVAFNTLMSFADGIIGAYLLTRDPFWMVSGALGGIISAASGLDLYWPPLAFLIGFLGGCMIPIVAHWIEQKLPIGRRCHDGAARLCAGICLLLRIEEGWRAAGAAEGGGHGPRPGRDSKPGLSGVGPAASNPVQEPCGAAGAGRVIRAQ